MVGVNIKVLLVIQLSIQVILAANECQFTSDCEKVEKCVNIQDTSCVCRFGECVFDGNPFFRNNECSSYNDCQCRRTPASCFCRDGTCENEAWECRRESDCKDLDKCKNKDCRCSSYNTCEPYDCRTEIDCFIENHFCSTLTEQGYTCKCSKNVCEIVQSAAPPSPPPPPPVKIGDVGPPLDIDGNGPPLNLDAFGPVFPPPPPLSNPQRSEDKSCSFSDDCKTVRSCIGIQDASCVCKRGECILDGNPFFRGTECDKYTDCACRNNPSNCFCRNGLCEESDWECHEKSDCKKMNKCKSVDCRCSYNDLCEPVECTTTQQCINQGADCVNLIEGYTCKCEKNVCDLTPI